MGEMRSACKILGGKREEKRSPEGTGVDGRIILKWILRK
jgi:hypothetical protein